MPFGEDRLSSQINFVMEAEKVTRIMRQNLVCDASRRENDAEHSWHVAMMAAVLSEYAVTDTIDILRVIKMLLVHDVVEIDAGDTFVYDDEGMKDKRERETKAAERIFSILPPEQRDEMLELWEEFEAGQSAEAAFAAALDRLSPLLHNYATEGGPWKEHGISHERVLARNAHIEKGAPRLWKYAKALIDDAAEKGYMKRADR